ncbi:hypothetical protein V6N13_143663 [Hibiscus sabdariffa]
MCAVYDFHCHLLLQLRSSGARFTKNNLLVQDLTLTDCNGAVEEFKLIEAQVKPDWQSGKSLTPGMKMGHELGKGRSWASLDLDDHPNY